MPVILPEASKAVLTPTDASQLHSYGLVIAQEEIYTERDEKRELFNRILQQGEYVTIEYRIDGIEANVVYAVSYLKPSHAYVGIGTTVVIEGESPNVRREVALKHRGLSSLLRFDIATRISRPVTSQPVTSRGDYHFNIQPHNKSSANLRVMNIREGKREGDTPEVRRHFRAILEEKLSWLEEQIRLCESSGLGANNLISEANSLKKELKGYR